MHGLSNRSTLKLESLPRRSQRIVLAFPRRPGGQDIRPQPGTAGRADALGPPRRHLTVAHGGEAARPEVAGLPVTRSAVNGIAAHYAAITANDVGRQVQFGLTTGVAAVHPQPAETSR